MAAKYAGELEVVTLGPLTNLALAILKEPAICEQIKQVTIMGGSGLGPGNITPVAEFNFFVDAEAAQIVIASGMKKAVVGWDVCYDETFINRSDMQRLKALSPLGEFAVRCNKTLVEFNKNWKRMALTCPIPPLLYRQFTRRSFQTSLMPTATSNIRVSMVTGSM